MNNQRKLNPVLLISAGLSIIGGLLAASLLTQLGSIVEWATSSENPDSAITWYYVASSIVTPVVAIGGGLLAILKRDTKLNLYAVAATWVIFNLLDWVFQAIWFSSSGEGLTADAILRVIFPVLGTQELFAFASLVFLVNPVLAFVALSIERKAIATDSALKSSYQNSPEGNNTMSNQQPSGYDPQTGAPIYGQPAQGQPIGYDSQTGAPIYGQPAQPQAWPKPESPLPLISLIGAFFFPLVGIIVGHIALGQMRRGEIPSSNEGLAKAGLILGYVFSALAVVFIFAYIAIFAAAMSGGYYY